jgi:surface antigen
MESINGCIVSYAVGNIGQEEIKGNMGFKDDQFEKYMREVGFRDTHAWCAYFAELCYHKAYQDFDRDKVVEVAKYFSAGAVRTFRKFSKAPGWVVDQTPEVGAVVIWAKYVNGKPHPKGYGHAAIVVEVFDDHIITVEGNTNKAGGREGIGVFEKKRKFTFESNSGLRMLGFIHPKK